MLNKSKIEGGGTPGVRRSQLLKGVLDLFLLSVISEEPSYGYEMVEKMKERGIEPIAEGSIYPLLTRLQKSSYVEGYMVKTPEGKRRKYYKILPAGEERLAEGRDDWQMFSEAANRVLGGE